MTREIVADSSSAGNDTSKRAESPAVLVAQTEDDGRDAEPEVDTGET